MTNNNIPFGTDGTPPNDDELAGAIAEAIEEAEARTIVARLLGADPARAHQRSHVATSRSLVRFAASTKAQTPSTESETITAPEEFACFVVEQGTIRFFDDGDTVSVTLNEGLGSATTLNIGPHTYGLRLIGTIKGMFAIERLTPPDAADHVDEHKKDPDGFKISWS